MRSELEAATRTLSPEVGRFMARALRSGWFEITSGAYEDGARGVCPIVAAASIAGLWEDGALSNAEPGWGTPETPDPEVVDFAAYFDLVAEEAGVRCAVEVVLDALESSRLDEPRRAA